MDPATHPLLSAQTSVMGPASTPQGRSFLSTGVQYVLPTQLERYELQNGTWTPTFDLITAPWPDSAYVIAALRANRRGVLLGGQTLNGHQLPTRLEDHPALAHLPQLPSGARVLDPYTLADVLKADPQLSSLPNDVPVVLAFPNAGVLNMQLAQVSADALNRTVWIPTSNWGLRIDGSGPGHFLGLLDRGGTSPIGAWVPIPPKPNNRKPTPAPRQFEALDGSVVRDVDVHRRPWVNDRSEWTATSFMPDSDDGRRREMVGRSMMTYTELYHVVRDPGGDGEDVVIGIESVSLPAEIFVINTHGLPGGSSFYIPHLRRLVWLNARDSGFVIGTLPEVADLPRHYRLYLNDCWSATRGDPAKSQSPHLPAPPVDDPLREWPVGLWVAMVSRLKVIAPTRSVGYNEARFRTLVATGTGERGRTVEFKPPPSPPELDDLARKARLHTGSRPASNDTRDQILAMVIALRSVFGDDVEDDPAAYEEKLRSIAALDTLRANDRRMRDMPFRMEVWQHAVNRLAGPTATALDRSHYQAALDAARQHLNARPDIRLTEAFGDPVTGDPTVEAVFSRWQSNPERSVRSVLRMQGNTPLSRFDVARAFWAAYRTEQRLSTLSPADQETLGRIALHPDPQLPADEVREKLRALMSQANAAPRWNAAKPAVLAAFDLELRAAFQQRLRAPGADGYNWGGTQLPAGIDFSLVFQEIQGPGGPTVAKWAAPWFPKDKNGNLVTTTLYPIHLEVRGGSQMIMHLPGVAVPVDPAEILELLLAAPLEAEHASKSQFLFLISGLGKWGRQLAQDYSNRTTRNTWCYSGDIELREVPGDPQAPRQIWLLPEHGTQKPGRWTKLTWQPPQHGGQQPGGTGSGGSNVP
ncbi:lonely Cys domain-containing protein [Streptomyces oryzae]|uniref:Lonely Cys domain-containing protein n=1 Tax=Streptomyces oryzae TaxID=1434886 RepID=A0ABS3XIY8_9ACTN|nr:lonely Cys domain-containing protein [Streptomyces oryzae]